MVGDKQMPNDACVNGDIRNLLYNHINKYPGITFQLLKSAFRIPEGTLRHHLNQLQKQGKIVQEKRKNERCYYSSFRRRYPQCPEDIKLSEPQERLMEIINENSGISRKEIMTRVQMDRKTLTYHLKRLKKLKLIWKVDQGGSEGYEMITRQKLKDEMFRLLVKKFVDGDIERESFFQLMKVLEEQ